MECECGFHASLKEALPEDAAKVGNAGATLSPEESDLVSRAREAVAFARQPDRSRKMRQWLDRAHASSSAAYATLEAEGLEELDAEEVLDGVVKLGKDAGELDFQRALECCKRTTSSVNAFASSLGLTDSPLVSAVECTNPERFVRECVQGKEIAASSRLAAADDNTF